MKILLKITLVFFVLNAFQSCSKEDTPEPEPIAQPEPEQMPEPENQPPTQVSLISPALDAQNIDVKPTFSWEAATDPDGDAITYEIYADATATPSTLIGTTSATNFEFEERLSLLENYSWKVVAKDDDGKESESNLNNFDTRSIITSNATTSAAFGDLTGHSTVVFNEKVWVIGGIMGVSSGGITNDIWNSEDGLSWNLVTDSPDFEPRHGHHSVVFENKIWIIGGYSNANMENKEVWSSENGIDWTLVTEEAGFDGGFKSQVAVFKNKIWMIDGKVWFSEDGAVWFLAYDETEIQGSTVVFNNKLHSIGGDFTIDIDISEDGFNWKKLEGNSNELFINQNDTQVKTFVFDNKLWNIGNRENSIFYTKDAINWKTIETTSVIPVLSFFTTAVKDSKVWIIGGSAIGSGPLNSVWFIN